MKIYVESIVRYKVGYIEDKSRVDRSRSLRKEFIVCLQAVLGNNKAQILHEDWNLK